MANFNATKGSASANSYVTTSEADDFFEYAYGSEDWFDISDDDKEKLLVSATRMIDQLKPKYSKAEDSQSLIFPCESNDEDLGDGYDQAKQACIIQALYLYRNNDAIQEAKVGALSGVKSESLGKVSKSVTGFNSVFSIDPAAQQLIAPYVDRSLKVTR